jgi:hypothetical protein
MKIKYIAQEAAILLFLLVLGVFALLQGTKFIESNLYGILEIIVVVSIIVAITSEVVGTIWSIINTVLKFLRDRKNKKKIQLDKTVSELEKKSRVEIE